ncbi:sterol desaturase family protein [Sphingomonas trueperi]|uniref:sterol desaturase family protein n=1 Tax=Sphingomonas trueperi TaxID=53317 RepID=UPI000EADAB4C
MDAAVPTNFEATGVQGGPVKRFIFTWFQPAVLLAMVLFWTLAPDSIAKASVAVGIGIVFKLCLLGMERISERHRHWRLTWKELASDLFYVGMSYTLIKYAGKHFGDDAIIDAIKHYFHFKTAWAAQIPILFQALAILLIFDFCQYWMHRGMHNWTPLWLTHAPHHHITQLNALKGSVGNPIELFLIGLSLGGFFDFLPRAALLAGGIGMAIGAYTHANIRFNTPRWWSFLFNTVEHHSLHHSPDYDSSRTNYANTFIFIDRIFGTCRDSEAAHVGLDDCRRLGIKEQMVYPFRPVVRWAKQLRAPRMPEAVAAE